MESMKIDKKFSLIGKLTQQEAFAMFDQLESVDLEFMYGKWKGTGLKTNHPMDGLLEITNWYGKEFIDSETVNPLIFQKKNGQLFVVNPGLVPLNLRIERLPSIIIKAGFKVAAMFIKTKTSKARLRMVEYRGKVSATMIYDQRPINDSFRKIDDNTVLGVMDLKGEERGYFFKLERVRI